MSSENLDDLADSEFDADAFLKLTPYQRFMLATRSVAIPEPIARVGGYHPDSNEPAGLPDEGAKPRKKRRWRKRRAKKVSKRITRAHEPDSEITVNLECCEGDSRWNYAIKLLRAEERWIGCIADFMTNEFIANLKRHLPYLKEMIEWAKQYWSADYKAEWLSILPASTVHSTLEHLHKWAWAEHRATSKLPDWSKWKPRLYYNDDIRYCHELKSCRLSKFYGGMPVIDERTGRLIASKDVWVPIATDTEDARYKAAFLAKHHLYLSSASLRLSAQDDGTQVLKLRIIYHSIAETLRADATLYTRIEENWPPSSTVDKEVQAAFLACMEAADGRMHSSDIVAKLATDYQRPDRFENGGWIPAAPLTERSLAFHLRSDWLLPKPKQMRHNGRNAQGYDLRQYFADRAVEARAAKTQAPPETIAEMRDRLAILGELDRLDAEAARDGIDEQKQDISSCRGSSLTSELESNASHFKEESITNIGVTDASLPSLTNVVDLEFGCKTRSPTPDLSVRYLNFEERARLELGLELVDNIQSRKRKRLAG